MDLRDLRRRAASAISRRDEALRMQAAQRQHVADLRLEEATCSNAAQVLAALATERRAAVARLLSQSTTAALQQVWGPSMLASVGEPDGEGSRAEARVVVASDGVYEDLGDSRGESVRVVADFALWVELMHLQVQSGQMAPFATFDEPFLALRPELFPLVASMFEACASSGIQLLVVTNQEGMIPETAEHVRLGRT